MKNRIYVKGSKRRISNKPEAQWTENVLGAGQADDAQYLVWGNNALFLTPGLDLFPYYTYPAQQLAMGGYTGDTFNAKYFKVNFFVTVIPGNMPNPSTKYRIIVVRSKNQFVNYSANVTQNLPADMLTEINTQNWDVQYDKTFTMNSGDDNNLQSPAKLFKFCIPCKENLKFQEYRIDPDDPGIPYFHFARDIFILLISEFVEFPLFTVGPMYCKFHYSDN